MSQVIFLKEQFGSALFYKAGEEQKQINFHPVGDDIGGIKLDDEVEADKPVIAALDQMIKDHVGGVFRATEGQYEMQAKKAIWRPSNPASEPLKVFQPNRRQPVSARPEDVAAVKDEPPAPVIPRRPTLNPAVAASLTAPGTPLPPAEMGAQPPAAPPVIKPRTGRVGQSRRLAPSVPENEPAAT